MEELLEKQETTLLEREGSGCAMLLANDKYDGREGGTEGGKEGWREGRREGRRSESRFTPPNPPTLPSLLSPSLPPFLPLDLSRMYRLFSRVPNGLLPMAKIVQAHIEHMGGEVINQREARINVCPPSLPPSLPPAFALLVHAPFSSPLAPDIKNLPSTPTSQPR